MFDGAKGYGEKLSREREGVVIRIGSSGSFTEKVTCE